MDPRAVPIVDASVVAIGGLAGAMLNGERLESPAGNVVEGPTALLEAMVEEFLEDGVVDVTRPSIYAFHSTTVDYIAADRTRTEDMLVELLAHDYLVHPDDRLGRRQAQTAAWKLQIDLWVRVAGREPPSAPPGGEPEIHRPDYAAFRAYLSDFSPAQLSTAMHAANILKSSTLGFLLAEQALDAQHALDAAAITRRMYAGDTQEELESEQEWEEELKQAIDRLLRYASLTTDSS
jgi:chaperone required for assembly of F1-ATPase